MLLLHAEKVSVGIETLMKALFTFRNASGLILVNASARFRAPGTHCRAVISFDWKEPRRRETVGGSR